MCRLCVHEKSVSIIIKYAFPTRKLSLFYYVVDHGGHLDCVIGEEEDLQRMIVVQLDRVALLASDATDYCHRPTAHASTQGGFV